jgi:DNA-directed RNA polymerase II subunit RPB1
MLIVLYILQSILKPKELWTGKQIFSLLLPEGINLQRFSSTHNDAEDKSNTSAADTKVVIINGELISGILDGDSLKTKMGGLVHILMLEQGSDATKLFLSRCQHVVNYWLMTRGFSIGLGDTIADRLTLEQISKAIDTAKQECASYIERGQRDQLERMPGRTMMETFEHLVNQSLNKASDNAGNYARQSLRTDNSMKAMCDAGSKGSPLNISQVIACVGQQNVQGKRIKFGFRQRTLPHFTKDDYGPESRGFVENSYLRGLTPQEFFFHAMAGREGLIDTAVKTAETGYIQRRLVKMMEDVMLKYDGTVRNSQSYVIQFLYGEDGLDACWIENQKLKIAGLSDDKFKQAYQWTSDDIRHPDFGREFMEPDLIEQVHGDPDVMNALDREFRQLQQDRDDVRFSIFEGEKPDETRYLPMNLQRLITNCQKKFFIDIRTKTNISPAVVVDKIRTLCERIQIIPGVDPLSIEASANGTKLLKILLRSTLSAKQVLTECRLTTVSFYFISFPRGIYSFFVLNF